MSASASIANRTAARAIRRTVALLAAGVLVSAADEPIEISPAKDAVRVACRVARQGAYEVLQGRIEYALTGPGGKGYESLLMTDADPRKLMDAIAAIGVKPGAPAGQTDGVERLPRGGRLRISVEFERNGVRERRPLGDFVRDAELKGPMGPGAWVYTGSLPGRNPATGEDVPQAALTGNLIALHLRDASVLVQNAQERARDFRRFLPESAALPPEGTPVTLILEPEPTIRRRYVVHGRVQGVGFRAFAERTARTNEVGGWARNRRDGTVEIEAEAVAPESLARFETAIAKGPRGAAVERVETTEPLDTEPLPAVFEVRATE